MKKEEKNSIIIKSVHTDVKGKNSLNGVYTGGCAHFYIHRFYTESMKGGMLMKSKHSTYGKKAASRSFGSYHFDDNFRHKSTIAALRQGRLL